MISICRDMGAIRDFMLLPEITRFAAEHGSNPEAEVFKTDDREIWLFYGDEIGLINMTVETGVMCEFHPYIRKDHKLEFDAMIKCFFKWFAENVPKEIIKLNVVIAKIHKGGIKAAEKAGMKHEGIDRLSYLSKFGACDRMLLGITRKEISNE